MIPSRTETNHCYISVNIGTVIIQIEKETNGPNKNEYKIRWASEYRITGIESAKR